MILFVLEKKMGKCFQSISFFFVWDLVHENRDGYSVNESKNDLCVFFPPTVSYVRPIYAVLALPHKINQHLLQQ